ncbi:hypothetical protein MLP_08210 [Microlunatus phosphovorus NM-1]|uniref:Uncharacterized protein n=1 Tax=Microlunatus phosphovorus (strain ATCC 700054 / DSM 10555 / JCM 9379 / NBRC 101784 / NCIMB 13414 / VKM Ac-1990 / NM-1) TaxID=1032480 RepID=F5XLV6_MICPN|nr:hypothetical protein MLP_08210 [Microlunatus phosphovorus NM-1]
MTIGRRRGLTVRRWGCLTVWRRRGLTVGRWVAPTGIRGLLAVPRSGVARAAVLRPRRAGLTLLALALRLVGPRLAGLVLVWIVPAHCKEATQSSGQSGPLETGSAM